MTGWPLLEEELGAVEVDGEGRGVAPPPGDVGVEVGSGEVLLARENASSGGEEVKACQTSRFMPSAGPGRRRV